MEKEIQRVNMFYSENVKYNRNTKIMKKFAIK